jgi:hypothetical protein
MLNLIILIDLNQNKILTILTQFQYLLEKYKFCPKIRFIQNFKILLFNLIKLDNSLSYS